MEKQKFLLMAMPTAHRLSEIEADRHPISSEKVDLHKEQELDKI